MIYVRQQFTGAQWELVQVAIDTEHFADVLTVTRRMDVTMLAIDGGDCFDVAALAETLIVDEAYLEPAVKLLMAKGRGTAETAQDLVVRAAKFIVRLHENCYIDAVPEEEP